MSLSLYTFLSLLFIIQLNAADLAPQEANSLSENSSSLENNQTANVEVTAKSWFYYREFIDHTQQLYEHHLLSHIDKAYLYGTDAVIVVGSGVDYTLYRILSYDDNKTEPPDVNVSLKEEKDDKNFFEAGIANEKSEQLEQYLSSQKGETALPPQIASSDRRKGERTYLISEWFGDETISNEFLDRTNHSYVRLRGGYAYNYRGDDEYIYSITARLKIPRTQDKLDLIIGDDTKSSSDLSLEGTAAERDESIALGMNNLFGLLEPVDTKLRLGFSGITNPYAKATFSYEALIGRWLFLPDQTFRYSREEEFEEWTNLDFKRRVAKEMMFSLLLQRSTVSTVDGMDYFVQPSLDVTLGKFGNFTPYMGVYGRTREQPEDTDGYRPAEGVYRYAIGLNWSRQTSRNYIVYRLQPILSYDDQYEFRPNYYVKALLEFYFGLRD